MTPAFFMVVVTALLSVDAFPLEASIQQQRVRRQVPGAPKTQDPREVIVGAPGLKDPTEPKYKKLAQESFENYRETHPEVSQIVVNDIIVTKVTGQLVEGYINRINFVVFPSYGNELQCYSKIYESFKGLKEYKVNCDRVKLGQQ
ncbi:uncharacterized protein LOC125232839 [Leguminivora glycinivorella]|uniref:uncharacterized protein LOC125232839 n=1 Tax=Leguminivora glycinivorella TaxID=1035111 RepID=UPI00200C0FA9|nr:uncharacterized protein LOC125232839 [Leguminivora glycinivorella]